VDIELRRVPTDDEIEAICAAAEEAARKVILSNISLKELDDLNVAVEATGDKPLSLSVDVAVEAELEDPDLAATIDRATDAAIAAADAKVRELDLCDLSSK